MQRNRKHNWLIYSGILSLILFIIFALIFGIGENNSRSSSLGSISFLFLFVTTTIVAPVYEEFVFRGIFSNKKYIKIVSIVLTFSIGLFAFYKSYGKIVCCFFVLISLSLVFVYLKNRKLLSIILISNVYAFVFALVHWTIKDFQNGNTSYLFLSQLALAYFLIWITINWGLSKSILVHILYNSILFFVGSYNLFFEDGSQQQKVTDTYKIQWSKVSILNVKSLQHNTDSTYKLTSTNLIELNRSFLNNKLDSYKFVNNPYQKFDFSFELKRRTTSYDSLQNQFINALSDVKLISSR